MICFYPAQATATATPGSGNAGAGAISLESISLAIQEVKEEFKKMTSTPTYDISSPQMSDSEIAVMHLIELKKKMPCFTMPHTDGPPICLGNDWVCMVDSRKEALLSVTTSAEEKAAIRHESYLCWQMTPYLQSLFEYVGIVVNSEDHKWVRTVSQEKQNFMKPDFFVALKGLMARQRSSGLSYIKNLRNSSGVGYDFGTMIWEVRDCMRVLVEFKNKLAPEHFGKLIIYLQHLSRDSQGCMYYGMLCDDTDIILASCCDSQLCSRYDLKWTTPGSQSFVRSFVSPQNRWMQLLDLSMSQLQLQLEGDDAFLGAGRNGRVFRVQRESRVYALKIVLTPAGYYGLAHSVFAEHKTLRDLKIKNLPVVTVMDDIICIEANGGEHYIGVCYLMEEVGTPVAVRNVGEMTAVFQLLLALHCQNEFHGDPRLSNIIAFKGLLLWIDFFTPHYPVSNPRDTLKMNFKRDMETLTKSLSHFCTVQNDAAFNEHVSAYANEPSEAHLALVLSTLSERDRPTDS